METVFQIWAYEKKMKTKAEKSQCINMRYKRD